MKKTAFIFSLIALLITTSVGCETAGTTISSQPNSGATAGASAQPAASASATPVQSAIAVDETKAAELLKQFNNQTPSKVVTVSVAITEILDVLGVTPVGVPTSSSKLPAAFDKVQRIGSSHQPDLEQIAKLQPNIILGPSSIKDNLDKKFKPANLPAAYIPTDSLDELKLSTVVLGRLFKQEAKATALLQKNAAEEKAALDAAKGKTAPKVMFLFGSAESLMLMNENTFAGSLAKNLGATNVVSSVMKAKETYVPVNMESIVAANPDIIMLVAHGDPAAAAKKFEEDVNKNGAWNKLNAFKNDKMMTLDYHIFGIASITKVADAYKAMADALYN